MTTFFSENVLKTRFSLFDENNKGTLNHVELCNVFRSLGWTDINATHCYNLMQQHCTGNSQKQTSSNPVKSSHSEQDTDNYAQSTSRLSSPRGAHPTDEKEYDPRQQEEDTEQEDEDRFLHKHSSKSSFKGSFKNTLTTGNDTNSTVGICAAVNFDQFRALVDKVAIPQDSPLECYKAFTLFDLTESGIIDEADLTEVAARLHGRSLSVKQRARLVKSMMTMADTNSDGKLTLQEFRAAAAKGGAGTEDGPIDLSVLVVDQPTIDAPTVNTTTNGTNADGSSRRNSRSSSAAVNGHRRGSVRSFSAGGANGAYPHESVVYGDDLITLNKNNADNGGTEYEGDHNADYVFGENGEGENGAQSSHVVNFEGIDVTFTDGKISKDEVAKFFEACGDLLVGDDFERWFVMEDTDGNGFLSEEQFRNTLEIFLSDGADDEEEL